jgi:hypothetical protein
MNEVSKYLFNQQWNTTLILLYIQAYKLLNIIIRQIPNDI